MLSILIPVYNCIVVSLVEDLSTQCRIEEIDFEIIVCDDVSREVFQKKNIVIRNSSNVIYEELDSRKGRSGIRNHMAKLAKYENLLFLDGDSGIEQSYINRYVNVISGSYEIVYGGRKYPNECPDPKKILHFKYGHKVESKEASIRMRKPWITFMSNNFLIKRTLFETIGFSENIKGYGYEDLIFAGECKKNNYSIHHIDNKVIHIGLDDATEFLAKTKEAISNLYRLIPEYKILNEVKLVRFATILQFLFISRPFILCTWMLENKLKKNILGKKPLILSLQWYKLYLYLTEKGKTSL
ncbi:MAG TPA: glycosyltransferase family 2 protein [Saprospiraceae bacterium]|nr:glycosyltransferase family 2 protein [Saprospiraceae bacterium]